MEKHHGPDTDTWLRLQQCLDEHYDTLKNIRAKQGHEAANIAQDDLLEGIDDPDVMERMFFEGQLRHPHATDLIEDTRGLYYTVMAPVPAPEEEKLKALRGIHRLLRDILEEIQTVGHTKRPIDLQRIFETVESYYYLAQKSEEAHAILNDIMGSINQLAMLIHKWPK
ncbi:MAG: hypothetical protein V1880_01125 [Patescibacteria group bacterium]